MKSVWRALPLLLVLPLLLTGCGVPKLSALQPMGPVAEMQLDLIKLSLGIMVLVVVVVLAIFAYVVIKFRERPGDDHIPEQVEGSHKLEIIWTVIPIILLIILAVPTVIGTFALAEVFDEEEAVQIEVIAHQFWWEFKYPEYGIVTAQDLYIPVGEKVQFTLTSNDVIHSLWIPALAGKTDTNPGEGNINKMHIKADHPGVYQGRCAELCGAAHALMDFKVIAVEADEFEQWVATMSDYNDIAEGAKEAHEEGFSIFEQSCLGCHAVDGTSSTMGPNLAGFADRETLAGFLKNDDEKLKKWIEDPNALKEVGDRMPAFKGILSDDEIDALIEYLQALTLK